MVIKKEGKKKVEKKEEKKEEKIDDKAKAPEKEEKAKAEKPKKEKTKKEKVDDAKRLEKAKQDVLKKSKLLVKIIGTTGQSSGGVLADVWSGDDSGMKNLDLAGAGGITTDASEALRTGSGGKGEAADIGDIGGVGGGTAELGGGPAVQLEAEVSVGEGEADMLSGDQSAVKKTVRRYSGQLQVLL